MGSETQQTSQRMAVTEAFLRPSALKGPQDCSRNHQERLDRLHQVASGDDDAGDLEAGFQCRGCKKIWTNEGRRQDPSTVVASFYKTGEFYEW